MNIPTYNTHADEWLSRSDFGTQKKRSDILNLIDKYTGFGSDEKEIMDTLAFIYPDIDEESAKKLASSFYSEPSG